MNESFYKIQLLNSLQKLCKLKESSEDTTQLVLSIQDSVSFTTDMLLNLSQQ